MTGGMMTRAIDSNILIYAFNETSEFQKDSKKLIKSLIKNNELGISIISLIEFFQVITNLKKFVKPLTIIDAQLIINSFMNSESVEILDINNDIINEAFKTMTKFRIQGYDIYDHIIAESCKYFNIKEFYTMNEKDFAKYKYFNTINPFKKQDKE